MVSEQFKYEIKRQLRRYASNIHEWDILERQGRISHTPATLRDYEEAEHKLKIYTPLVESDQWDIIAKMTGYEEKIEASAPEPVETTEDKKSVIPE